MARLFVALDFDGTITCVRCCSMRASLLTPTHRLKDTLNLLPPSPSLLAPLSEAYLHDLKAFKPALPAEQRTTPHQELAHLASLRPIDLASVQRVSSSRILADSSSSRLDRARSVELRPGWSTFATEIEQRGHEPCIISVNWSSAFIRAATSVSWRVRANETTEEGVIEGDLHSCPDKTMAFIEEQTRAGAERSIYFGDGEADLGALLEADLGVVMGEARSLRSTCERIGVNVTLWNGSLPRGGLLSVKDSHEALQIVQAFDTST